jgi:hypothetical protein
MVTKHAPTFTQKFKKNPEFNSGYHCGTLSEAKGFTCFETLYNRLFGYDTQSQSSFQKYYIYVKKDQMSRSDKRSKAGNSRKCMEQVTGFYS